MKPITILSAAFSFISSALHAQEGRPNIVPPKNVIDVKKPELPANNLGPKGIPVEIPPKNLPDAVSRALTTHGPWNLIRWWITGNIGHSISDPGFTFLVNGDVQCHLTTPEAVTILEAGSYSVSGNNVTITFKKGPNVLMNCNMVYDASAKKLSGTYSLQVSPVPNPPAGYTAGTVNGTMEIR